MSFLQRMSNSVWAYLSPPKPTPKETRHIRTREYVNISRSQPAADPDMRSPTDRRLGDKRKRGHSPPSTSHGNAKKGKMDGHTSMEGYNGYEAAETQQQGAETALTRQMNRLGLCSPPPTSPTADDKDIEMKEGNVEDEEIDGKSHQPQAEEESEEQWLHDVYRPNEEEGDSAIEDAVTAHRDSQGAEDEYPENLSGWNDESELNSGSGEEGTRGVLAVMSRREGFALNSTDAESSIGAEDSTDEDKDAEDGNDSQGSCAEDANCESGGNDADSLNNGDEKDLDESDEEYGELESLGEQGSDDWMSEADDDVEVPASDGDLVPLFDEENASQSAESGIYDEEVGDQEVEDGEVEAEDVVEDADDAIDANDAGENDSGEQVDYDPFVDVTEVLSPGTYTFREKWQKDYLDITAPENRCARTVTTEELQSTGHSASHVRLVHALQDRGFEPLIPSAWWYDFQWLPQILFSHSYSGDDEPAPCPPVLIRSIQNKHPGGFNMLRNFMQLGQYTREAIGRANPQTGEYGRWVKRPDQKAHQMIKVVERWTRRDSGMHTPRADEVFPMLLAYVVRPKNTPSADLETEAADKMREILRRYRRNFHVPTPADNTAAPAYAIELPTVYTLILSHTLVALVCLRPVKHCYGTVEEGQEDADARPEMVCMLDLASAAHDVWNVLGVCIVLCHLRDVRRGFKERVAWVDDSPEEVDVDL